MSQPRVIEAYCSCGAGMEGSVDGDKVFIFLNWWWEEHSGIGHSPCTREEAVQAHIEKEGFEPWKREEAGDGRTT